MQQNRTELGALGEFGLIDKLTDGVELNDNGTVLGVGDDAAILNPSKGLQVVSTDMLVEGVHFDLSYVPLQHLGYKAISVNVSDVAAMNCVPKQVTVSIAVSNRFSLEAMEALYSGVKAACQNFKVDLVGGDTTSSRSGLVISVTVLGESSNNQEPVRRSGAKEGDILCATGDLGGAFVGLQVLERQKVEYLANPEMQPDIEKYAYVVQRQLKPEARMDIIHELSELEIKPTSMIDVSDGLASEVFHLSKHSGIGFNIYEDKVPIDRETYNTAVEFNLDPITCALNGGEDYELLFTIDQEDYKKLEKHYDIHFIGYAQELSKGINLITKQQNVVPIQAQGWNHFNEK
ncbi:thiamine-phosphate kinase [Aureibacter tunicatorum]|uniref:Thiamine-monophosphate kinase n=1 Tax=Aureibacter tunicatorum TaxID=866807 RepID=A0AAE4BSQ4_9BACT|nr:thiamine-phosphate kinase [Aureibacter tunicatorum]MDR6239110.1 thiamine-monophosphate kinase [Aureibacter tunicatorum]BDD04964.1 thiamine-monophosphate kinase [Aureibacter tunicatorum]